MRTKLSLIVITQLMVCTFCFSQKKINWNIYDQHHNQVTEVSAQEISIVNDLIWYKTNQKFAVMDLSKNNLILPIYETIYHYRNGMTAVGIKNCFGLVYGGKEILPLRYSNLFLVDSSGYIRAEKGCSENPEAYIISEHTIYDQTGKLIFQGCEEDANSSFNKLTGRSKKNYASKNVSNGFIIKLMSSDTDDVRKGIYNRKDSLIFSCRKCTISDNVNGTFFINEKISNSVNETYTIDTLGAVKLKGGYNLLHRSSVSDLYLYSRGDEKGVIDSNGRVQFKIKSTIRDGLQLVSGNRFLVSIPDSSGKVLSTICDSSGIYLFSPVQDHFQIVSNNCLVRKTRAGYLFTNADGNPVSDVYDSVFPIPDFNYKLMAEGVSPSYFGSGSDVKSIFPLDRDGFSPIIKATMFSHYGMMRGNKIGLFITGKYAEVVPQYALIARVNDNLFAAKKADQWFTLSGTGELTSYGKNKYINFFDEYVLVGR